MRCRKPMDLYAHIVDWNDFTSKLERSKSYEVALESNERIDPSPMLDSCNSPFAPSKAFCETWLKIRDLLDPPWANEFENVFDFDLSSFEPSNSDLRKLNEYEAPTKDSSYFTAFDPEQVRLRAKACEAIKFKPLFARVPKKLRGKYILMANRAKSWKEIYKIANSKGMGVVISAYWES